MNDNQRLQLQQMIKTNDVTNNTELIRDLKHSSVLRDEVNVLILNKAKNRETPERVHEECMNECNFLYTYYTDIYNKIRKDELNVNMFFEFLDVLHEIEEGTIDQHEASFKVGTMLKNIYIDSAIKKSEMMDKLYNSTETSNVESKEVKNVSWKQYKQIQKSTNKNTI
jgi:hypothetical protein